MGAVAQAFAPASAIVGRLPSPSSPRLLLMSSLRRLDWLISEVSSGRSASVHFSIYPVTQREKIKFILHHGYDQREAYRPVLLSSLNSIKIAMGDSIVTDKGHTSKSSGDSVIEFFIRQRVSHLNPSAEAFVPGSKEEPEDQTYTVESQHCSDVAAVVREDNKDRQVGSSQASGL